jgi:hypothetical protein
VPSGLQEPSYLWAYRGLQCRYRLDASMTPRCLAQQKTKQFHKLAAPDPDLCGLAKSEFAARLARRPSEAGLSQKQVSGEVDGSAGDEQLVKSHLRQWSAT